MIAAHFFVNSWSICLIDASIDKYNARSDANQIVGRSTGRPCLATALL